MSEVQRETIEWLWDGRLPLGKLVILDGDPGLGKSTLTAELAARVSSGRALPFEPILKPKPEPGGVVIATVEDGLGDTLRPRLEACGAELDRIAAYNMTEGKTPTLDTDLPHIEETAREHGAKLVILDPLMALLGSDVDAHKDQDVRRVLSPVAQMATRLGACVLVVRHLNKSNGGPAVYRGGGSIGIIGAARVGMVLARDPADEDPSSSKRILAVAKNNLARMARSLTFELKDGAILWTGESELGANEILSGPTMADPEQRGAVAEAELVIRQALADGPLESKELERRCKEAGVAPAAIRRARPRICATSKTPGGPWRVQLKSGERARQGEQDEQQEQDEHVSGA